MTIAVLTAPLFEDVELWYPYYRLIEAGYDVELVGADADTEYAGKRGTTVRSTMAARDADPSSFDAVVIPGGYSPDHMRRVPEMVDLVKQVGTAGTPTAAICHGPWMLASAGLASGRRMTSFPSIRDDLANAGATWVDEEVVEDGPVITSRSPDDLPAFMRTLLERLGDRR
ncbi:MAG: type 1 glutamine amidotransferase domain-containing protein [Acidimicrobiia bacterium]|nr:type 1 glutamine amidotransferase domain-containing protein [Acidimicrobiia bacterium]